MSFLTSIIRHRYTRGLHLRELTRDATLHELVTEGRLTVVLWDEMPTYNFGHMTTYADQAIIYNHALLSHWDQPDTWLAMLDADEYFATFSPTNVTDLWATCFR